MGTKINDVMTILFGASWRSAISGYLEALAIGTLTYFYTGGMVPTDVQGWAGLGLTIFRGISAYNTKDKQVSNSPAPKAAAMVSVANEATVNPAAKAIVPCLALLLLAGCSAFQTTDPGAVLMKLSADRQSVLVAGCAGMPARHVLLNTILPFIPPQYGVPAAGALAIETVAASALCAQVQAAPVVSAPFVASSGSPMAPVVPVVPVAPTVK